MKNKQKIKCKCGRVVTTNTLATHMSNSVCTLDNNEKNKYLGFFKMWGKHPRAWKISDGIEAVADASWRTSVFLGNSDVSEWRFESPRPRYTARPSARKRLSKERLGDKNPACKNLPPLNKEVFEKYLKETWNNSLEQGDVSYSQFIKQVNKKWPKWSYHYANSKEKSSALVRKLLGINKADFDKIYLKVRGVKISIAQRNSPEFMEMARAMGAQLISKWRITRPHRELMEMIHSVDNDARIEHSFTLNGRHVSYDIISPKINALIEMHGRVWHDIDKTNDGLRHIVEKNIQNDKIKAKGAIDRGFKLLIFWSDEQELWEETIEKEYGIKPISIQEAKDKVSKIPGYEKGIRPRNANTP